MLAYFNTSDMYTEERIYGGTVVREISFSAILLTFCSDCFVILFVRRDHQLLLTLQFICKVVFICFNCRKTGYKTAYETSQRISLCAFILKYYIPDYHTF